MIYTPNIMSLARNRRLFVLSTFLCVGLLCGCSAGQGHQTPSGHARPSADNLFDSSELVGEDGWVFDEYDYTGPGATMRATPGLPAEKGERESLPEHDRHMETEQISHRDYDNWYLDSAGKHYLAIWGDKHGEVATIYSRKSKEPIYTIDVTQMTNFYVGRILFVEDNAYVLKSPYPDAEPIGDPILVKVDLTKGSETKVEIPAGYHWGVDVTIINETDGRIFGILSKGEDNTACFSEIIGNEAHVLKCTPGYTSDRIYASTGSVTARTVHNWATRDTERCSQRQMINPDNPNSVEFIDSADICGTWDGAKIGEWAIYSENTEHAIRESTLFVDGPDNTKLVLGDIETGSAHFCGGAVYWATPLGDDHAIKRWKPGAPEVDVLLRPHEESETLGLVSCNEGQLTITKENVYEVGADMLTVDTAQFE